MNELEALMVMREVRENKRKCFDCGTALLGPSVVGLDKGKWMVQVTCPGCREIKNLHRIES